MRALSLIPLFCGMRQRYLPEGYEDKVVEITLDQVAEIGAWGEGFYKPDARTFVDDILKNCRPVEESTSEWLFEEKERLQEHNLQITISGGGRKIKSI